MHVFASNLQLPSWINGRETITINNISTINLKERRVPDQSNKFPQKLIVQKILETNLYIVPIMLPYLGKWNSYGLKTKNYPSNILEFSLSTAIFYSLYRLGHLPKSTITSNKTNNGSSKIFSKTDKNFNFNLKLVSNVFYAAKFVVN